MILVLVAAFLVLLFAGIPIAYILGLVALLGISRDRFKFCVNVKN